MASITERIQGLAKDAAIQDVHITDIKIPFESMIVLLVKWALAGIPALIILAVFFAIVIGFLKAIFG
jgi:hypothetical protein